LGLPWDPACLDFYKTKRTVKTASTNQVRQPVYKSSSGRWRKHAAQLQPLLKALGIQEEVDSAPASQPITKAKSVAKTAEDLPVKKTVIKPAKKASNPKE
jgi:hypothetical protein